MKKILIIRFSSIGDIVLTSPIARCVKLQVKNCELHFLTKKSFESIVANNPHIDKVYSIEKHIDEVIPQLKLEKYDFVIDLHYNIRSLLVRLKLNRPSFKFNKTNLKKWLMVNWKIKKKPNTHIVDRYFKAVRKLGVRNDGLGLDFFIPESQEVSLSTLPATHQNGYIAFVIGAKHFTKRMPPEKILSICKKITQPIIFLGGPEDKELALYLTKEIGPNCYNACGIYSLQQSASLVKQAKKVITHDTGLMHIAAAFKKDIISIWGSTIPEFGMSPYFPGNSKAGIYIEVADLACRPCSKIGFSKCPKGHFKCMKDISEAQIISALA